VDFNNSAASRTRSALAYQNSAQSNNPRLELSMSQPILPRSVYQTAMLYRVVRCLQALVQSLIMPQPIQVFKVKCQRSRSHGKCPPIAKISAPGRKFVSPNPKAVAEVLNVGWCPTDLLIKVENQLARRLQHAVHRNCHLFLVCIRLQLQLSCNMEFNSYFH